MTELKLSLMIVAGFEWEMYDIQQYWEKMKVLSIQTDTSSSIMKPFPSNRCSYSLDRPTEGKSYLLKLSDFLQYEIGMC